MESTFQIDVNSAEEHLKKNSSIDNVLDKVHNMISNWSFQSDCDLSLIKNDLDSLVLLIIDKWFNDSKKTEILSSVNCVIYNQLHDDIFKIAKVHNSYNDLKFYEKCIRFSKKNVSLTQLGSNENYAIRFSAAIVELSILDNYKSPEEKMNCLCNTYDLLFAELKKVIVSMESKYEDKDYAIPIINNKDLHPLILFIVIRSKLLYMFSNMFYIMHFGPQLLVKNKKNIFETFQVAVTQIANLSEESLKQDSEKIEKCLKVCESMEFVSILDSSNFLQSYIFEEKLQIAQQISSSTSQNKLY